MLCCSFLPNRESVDTFWAMTSCTVSCDYYWACEEKYQHELFILLCHDSVVGAPIKRLARFTWTIWGRNESLIILASVTIIRFMTELMVIGLLCLLYCRTFMRIYNLIQLRLVFIQMCGMWINQTVQSMAQPLWVSGHPINSAGWGVRHPKFLVYFVTCKWSFSM